MSAESAWPASGTYFAACFTVSRLPTIAATRTTRSRVMNLPMSIDPTTPTAFSTSSRL